MHRGRQLQLRLKQPRRELKQPRRSSSSEGSAADSSTASTPDDGEKQTSFKIFAGVSELSPDNSEKPIVQQMNEAKGVTIEWNCVSGDTLTEKKNLMLNAGSDSMPDAFMAAQLKDAEIMTCGTRGLFIPLEDYINEETMPNLMSVLEVRPDALAACTMPDGISTPCRTLARWALSTRTAIPTR